MNCFDQNNNFLKTLQNLFLQSQMMNHSPTVSSIYSPLSSSSTSFSSPIKSEMFEQEEPLNLSVKEETKFLPNSMNFNNTIFFPSAPFYFPPMFQQLFTTPILQNSQKFDNNIYVHNVSSLSSTEFKRRRSIPLKVKKSRSFKCNQCRNMFTCLSTLSDHTQKEHGGYKCHICETSFTQRSNLQRHALRHVGFKPYKCNVCAKEYYRKDHLIRHISFNHPTVNPKENIIQRLSSSESLNFIDHHNNEITSCVKEESHSPSQYFVSTPQNSFPSCNLSNNDEDDESLVEDNIFLSNLKDEMTVDVMN